MSQTKQIVLPFEKRKFNKENSRRALDSLVLGVKVLYGSQKKQITVYQSEVDIQLLVLLPHNEPPPKKLNVLDMRDIIDIQEQAPEGFDQKLQKLCIMVDENNIKHYFIFSNQEQRDLFWQGLQSLIQRALVYKQEMFEYYKKLEEIIEQNIIIFQNKRNMKADYVKQMALDLFSKADTDLSDNLSYEEGYLLLKKISFNINKKELFQKFDEFDQNKDKMIQQEEFIKIARDLLQKTELKHVFMKFAQSFTNTTSLNQGILKKEDFFKFLETVQKQPVLDDDLSAFLDVFFEDRQNEISYNDFTNLVINYQNTIYNPNKLNIYQVNIFQNFGFIQFLLLEFRNLFLKFQFPSLQEFQDSKFLLISKLNYLNLQQQSMDQPLTDYFINSSHNTYLMANQLTGDSSVQAYINAFRKGCRCIEIDAWDGSNGPIVTHGFTLTTSIKFKDIIEAIKTYGFVWSKYPIIVSIENHCNKANQKEMAQILRETLGQQLYLIPEDYDSIQFYPSPKQLKRKIIVKSKGCFDKIIQISSGPSSKRNSQGGSPGEKKILDQFVFNDVFHKDQISLNQVYQLEHTHSNQSDQYEHIDYLLEVPQPKKQYKSAETIIQNQDSEQVDEQSDEEDERNKFKPLNVKDFQRCISMVGVSYKLDNVRDQKNVKSIYDIFSLSEEKILKLLEKHEKDIVSYHRNYLSRIYPKGSRVDSSNFDPQPSFNSGSQIIALNFQTNDNPLFMYLSKFQQNGGIYSGYVLKPKFLCHFHQNNNDLSDHSKCNKNDQAPQNKLPSELVKPLKELRITVVSGQCLKSEEDEEKQFSPFVEIQIKGTQIDEEINKPQRTQAIANNTFHPIFNSQTMVFHISCPELAMVSFQVISSGILKDDLIAQYALDFECIREGFRVIPLWNKDLEKIEHALLLAHIEIISHDV